MLLTDMLLHSLPLLLFHLTISNAEILYDKKTCSALDESSNFDQYFIRATFGMSSMYASDKILFIDDLTKVLYITISIVCLF